MASAANFVETGKAAAHGLNGAASLINIYCEWTATSAGYSAVTDVNGDPVNMDFDGKIVEYNVTCDTSAGAGAVTFALNGTDFLAVGSVTADQNVSQGTGFDVSEADFSAGSAAITVTSANNTKSGFAIFRCIKT